HHLGIASESVLRTEPARAPALQAALLASAARSNGKSRHSGNADQRVQEAELKPITIVVPFFNEEAALPYFCNTFERMEQELADSYRLRFIFVDDGSSDRTWELLNQKFRGRKEC